MKINAALVNGYLNLWTTANRDGIRLRIVESLDGWTLWREVWVDGERVNADLVEDFAKGDFTLAKNLLVNENAIINP